MPFHPCYRCFQTILHMVFPKEHFFTSKGDAFVIEDLQDQVEMCVMLFAFTIHQHIIFDVKRIWAIFYHFFDVLLYLAAGWACSHNHSFIAKYSPGGAKCKQFPCFFFNFRLMVTVSDVEHGEAISSL